MARPASFVPHFNRDAYAPGDTVDGVLEVVEDVGHVRRLDAALKYVDRSPYFAEGVVHAAVEPLHEGPVEVGQRFPFALTLPADALPPWDDPSTKAFGRLGWSLVIETDIAHGLDRHTTLDVPIAAGATWTGPAPDPDTTIRETAKWDVSITPSTWALRRGETLVVTMAIEKPDASRDSIELGLLCQAAYAIETTRTDSDGSRSTMREIRNETLLEVWPPVDPAQATQTFEFVIPEDAPFTYYGGAFGFRWFVVAKEARRLRTDPHRSTRIQVLP